MKIETQIKLDRFSPRDYQLPIIDAVENKGYKRVLAILPRRAGKDITAFNLCIRQCIRKVCTIYYIFPTYSQGKKVLFDGLINTGERILDYIPRELVASINSQEMKIRFINGSLFQIVGSDNYDSLMGTNPHGIVFSEYALQDPRAYQYLRPILTANNGWALFISTPRGKNHLYELYEIAQQSSEWFCYKLTLDDTNHIPLREIEKERIEGIMSEDLIQQEYYTSFTMGVEGSYYAKYLDRMRLNGQIGQVPWENAFKVNTVWDIGVRDATTIIFFQIVGQTVRIIDCYENAKVGLEHYIKVIEQRPYIYGKHIAPHDIRVREFGSGMTRWEKAKQLGITFTIAPDVSIEDGIESVRSAFSKIWINQSTCLPLLKSLENYRQEYDAKRKIYKSHPLHDWSCFIGETPLLTRNGIRWIMEITEKDEILTKYGWMKCNRAQIMKESAELVEVVFKDGTTVKCTPDHQFLTVNSWKSAKNLEKDTEIQSSLMSLPNILMDIYTDYGHLKDILQKGAQDCIGTFGETLLEKYQTIVIFITEIMTQKIIISGIYNAYLLQSISHYLDQVINVLQKNVVTPLQNGTDQKREDYGIDAKHCERNHGQNGNEKNDHVCIVRKNMRVLFERMVMYKNFVMQIAKPLIIEEVKFLNEKANVYCINVPLVHHFSLINGAIVHNSHFADSMRYLCISLPRIKDGSTPEQLEKRYYEAIYGNERLPIVFDDGFKL